MQVALTREISPTLGGCELSYLPRTDIDIALAQRQHAAYRQVLSDLGCRVLWLPALEDHPDAVFVEDVAVVFDEVAVMTRPGAASRRGESATVAEVLAGYRPLLRMSAPATLDGGDVLRIGRDVLVGSSGRTNAAGIGQLQALLREYGYKVRGVPVKGCLHLKSAVTQVGASTVLANPEWIDPDQLAGLRVIPVDPDEPHAANGLLIGSMLVYPACFPRTRARLAAAGIDVVSIDVSELQKAEGAVTCCSLVFDAAVVG